MRLSDVDIKERIDAVFIPRGLYDFARVIEAATVERCAKACTDYGDEKWSEFKRGDAKQRGSQYIEGLSDGAHELAIAIRAAYKETPHE